ncbi:hypothetical protein [Pelagibius sp. Alg239-R121]|uniref:hypothetical protein n=1 Tax=Pelagibius sp. Alg239-R121 TaxID=2993448 RepID=UPI0024A6C696|nr:hypothetical protein [Pelagibius sp. Alg239-R121]
MTVREDDKNDVRGSRALQNALDAVGAVGDSGFVLVPSEPSDEMILAGARAGGISTGLARTVYRAMLGETS